MQQIFKIHNQFKVNDNYTFIIIYIYKKKKSFNPILRRGLLIFINNLRLLYECNNGLDAEIEASLML